MLPVDHKLVIFESFLGKQYSCNPRAIYEYLQSHHPEYKMYWSVDKRYTAHFEEAGIPYLNRFSFSWLLKMTQGPLLGNEQQASALDSKAEAHDLFANVAWYSIKETCGRYE